MTEYRVLAADGKPWGLYGSEVEAVAFAVISTKRYPDRAPFTVQRAEWVDVPLPELLPDDLPTTVWTCEAWRGSSGHWATDPLSPLPGRGRRFRSRVDWEEVPE